MLNMILISTLTVGGLALLFGFALGYAAKKLYVEVDEKIEKINNILPGVNCGACGYPGCSGYSKAIVEEKVPITLCAPGGSEVQSKIAEIMGMEVESSIRMVAHIKCVGDKNTVKKIGEYDGIKSCNAVHLTLNGDKACAYGCLGYGDCERVCPFDAIHINLEIMLPEVNEEKCTGCGLCVQICPRDIIELVPENAYTFINCVSKDFGPDVMSVCKKGCIGCGLCVKFSKSEGIKMENNLAVIDFKKYKGEPIVAEKCPTKVIEFREEIYKKDNTA